MCASLPLVVDNSHLPAPVSLATCCLALHPIGHELWDTLILPLDCFCRSYFDTFTSLGCTPTLLFHFFVPQDISLTLSSRRCLTTHTPSLAFSVISFTFGCALHVAWPAAHRLHPATCYPYQPSSPLHLAAPCCCRFRLARL